MKKHQKRLSGMMLLGALLWVMTVFDQALAQEKFPSKPITVIVPWEPGGADINLRVLQPHLEKAFAQPIIVINKPGGAGTIGFSAGAGAAPDGHTITLVTPSIVVTPYTVIAKPDYRNFEPVVLTAEIPTVVAVQPDAPWKTFKEFLDYAKANPGKIRMSNSGHGAMYHIGAIGLEAATRAKFTHVPYKGSGPANIALAGGHVEAAFTGYSTVAQLITNGRLRLLAVASAKRYYAAPEIPTFKESGVDLELSTWYGYVAPKGTPKERIKVIHDGFKKGIDSPEYQTKMKELAAGIRYLNSEDFGRFLEQQDSQWLKLIEGGGFKTP